LKHDNPSDEKRGEDDESNEVPLDIYPEPLVYSLSVKLSTKTYNKQAEDWSWSLQSSTRR